LYLQIQACPARLGTMHSPLIIAHVCVILFATFSAL
jgi:hypothetical protein